MTKQISRISVPDIHRALPAPTQFIQYLIFKPF